VISSYAAPLLEGCGTIQKGDLRVVGTTVPVPFIDAFVVNTLPEKDRAAIKDALLHLVDHPPLLIALETQKGFVAEPSNPQKKSNR
jgi:ABC-type phosphate/phosphonate transport system substrate-binding protein